MEPFISTPTNECPDDGANFFVADVRERACFVVGVSGGWCAARLHPSGLYGLVVAWFLTQSKSSWYGVWSPTSHLLVWGCAFLPEFDSCRCAGYSSDCFLDRDAGVGI